MTRPTSENTDPHPPSSLKYAGYLLTLIVIMGGVSVAKGGLFINSYEVDVAHMIDIILRMTMGQVPHLDFSTPIGILSFLPIVLFTKLGFGVGMSFLLAQIAIALVLAPIAHRAALSRLYGISAWFFGFCVMVFTLALVYGSNEAFLSVSMYYNRWAWAVSFIVLVLAMVSPFEGRDRQILDGILIGLLLATLGMLKPTYFVALAIPVVIGLTSRGAVKCLIVSVISGLALSGVFAGVYGGGFYLAYVQDLISVVISEGRSAPGTSFSGLLGNPEYFVATVTLLASVIILRQAGQMRAGLLLLLLAPALIYVTYQNFGNDPKWLLFLSLYLMMNCPEAGRKVMFGIEGRNAIPALALVAFSLNMPSLHNLMMSPMRHLGQDEEEFSLQVSTPIFANDLTADIWAKTDRMSVLLEQTAIVDRIPALVAYEMEQEEPLQFLGETLPRCNVQAGYSAVNTYIADILKLPPFNYQKDTQFFTADIASEIWMRGGFAPLQGGAPWHYSGTPGIDNADAILIPICPLSTQAQTASLEALEEKITELNVGTPVRNGLIIVYPLDKTSE